MSAVCACAPQCHMALLKDPNDANAANAQAACDKAQDVIACREKCANNACKRQCNSK